MKKMKNKTIKIRSPTFTLLGYPNKVKVALFYLTKVVYF